MAITGSKLPEALELAQKELEVRHDIYTWDTLAWVLYKNGRFQDAAKTMNKALALHTKDPLLLFHAGMIYHALAEDSEAEDVLTARFEDKPGLSTSTPKLLAELWKASGKHIAET